MRILAIGLGGAGGRIVNQLYRADRSSSKVACVQALAVDVDEESMKKLVSLPDASKLCFPPVDLTRPDVADTEQSATIDIAEVAAHAQTLTSGETDAIVLCMGLGGSLANAAPNIITTLRSSMTEPIFALVTLPCHVEGERISAKAADDIETISPLLDGIIVFDNETWHKKVKTAEKKKPPADQGVATLFGLKKKSEPVLSPAEKIYALLNEAIVRRISLILRAGEFKADGGLDLAEVVLDAGEVLNTMRGMGFITIGYAVEQLPSHPLDFLARLRPTGYFADEHMKKASRIIDLAKQAIYHEVSAPCDITSAHKALILIAGPSHELSMKGYMTVRKWIDRSIAGLETRSGDYPVMSTRFVAIIIMLSGLENIPRINELKEIRAQFRTRASEGNRLAERPGAPAGSDSRIPADTMRDEMITLPSEKKPVVPPVVPNPTVPVSATGKTLDIPAPLPAYSTPERPIPRPLILPEQKETAVPSASARERAEEPSDSIKKYLKSRPPAPVRAESPGVAPRQKVSSDQERRRIELELQKQRHLAIHGSRDAGRHHVSVQKKEPVIPVPDLTPSEQTIASVTQEAPPVKHVIVKKQADRKVIIRKKTGRTTDEGQPNNPDSPEGESKPGNPVTSGAGASAENDTLDSWIHQVTERKKVRQVGEQRPITIDEAIAPVSDSALVHTDLKRGRTAKDIPGKVQGMNTPEPVNEPPPAGKKRDRKKDDEDVSFVE